MPITGTGEAAAVDPVASLVTALTTAAGNYASPQGAWSSSTTYTLNQVVTYGGGTYRAKTASTNIAPGTDATKWESWGGGVLTSQGNWVTSTSYIAGDVVTRSGQRYACRTVHTSGTFATDLAALKWVSLDAVTALAASSNLSDVVSVSSAQTNLGAGAASGLATLDSSTMVPAAQLGTGAASSTKVLSGDRSWATAVTLALSGQTPAQEPVTLGTAAVGSQATGARSDHVHPSGGMFWVWGSGVDGDLVFDGTSTVTISSPFGNTVYTPSVGVYTVAEPIAARNLTLGSGVVLAMSQGCPVYVQNLLSCPSGSATIQADGKDGNANGTAGATRAAAGIPAAGAAGAGNTGAGTAGSNPVQPSDQYGGGSSGAGGAGASGAGGSNSLAAIGVRNGAHWISKDPLTLLRGVMQGTDANSAAYLASLAGSAGGGGGAGDSTNKGGGGGSGAGLIIVNARVVTGAVNVRAKGGAGGTPTTGNCGGGGGGGGGYTFLNSTDLTAWTGTCTAPGGTAGSGVGTGSNGNNGATGIAVTTTWK